MYSIHGLRIGVTIGLRDASESLWSNGIKQNALFLIETLRNCPNVQSVTIVNTTPVRITSEVPWDLIRWPVKAFEEVKDQLDILIELGGQVDLNATVYLKERGARLVSYCCGFEYIHAMESVLFNRPLFGYDLFVNQRYDDIWMVPQVASNSKSYFEVLRRAPAKTVPFIWSPIFVEQKSKDLVNAGLYTPSAYSKRLTVMEPNIDVVKFCLYPVLIAEMAYRHNPGRIKLLQVLNADRIARESPEFISLMNQLDIVRNHKAIFLGRHDTPTFLAASTDIVLSHQWDNALNYFYLEVCWQGYPLIHNAYMCSDLGYYYEANRVEDGVRAFNQAMELHDADLTGYFVRQRRIISRYFPDNKELVTEYADLIDELMKNPVRS